MITFISSFQNLSRYQISLIVYHPLNRQLEQGLTNNLRDRVGRRVQYYKGLEVEGVMVVGSIWSIMSSREELDWEYRNFKVSFEEE